MSQDFQSVVVKTSRGEMPSAPETRLSTSSGARSNEVEERRIATRRILWIGAIAWPIFVLTDFADAALSGHPEILAPLLAIRGTGVVIVAILLFILRKPNVSSRTVTACDAAFVGIAAFLISLEAIFIGGFELQVVLGIMILAFMRASLLPSHWLRTLIVAGAAVLILPLTAGVASLFNARVRQEWLGPGKVGPMAYALAQIMAGVVMGSAGSHMAWRARRQVFEARKLGQYRLKARIGSGGAGDVWLARQDALDRDVALKVLRTRGREEDADSRRRFAREARAASSLCHPNTIRVIDYGASDDGVYFMAMELLDGVDLYAVVTKNGPLPPARTIHLAIQACGSLAEAHAAKIVHRDIKPANLFVCRIGEDTDFLKLLDFGIAQMVEGDRTSTLTEFGMFVGTPAYMPPEACAGERVDARGDLYSLGAVMYFMLSGTELFPDKSMTETIMSQMNQEPEPLGKRMASRGLTVPADLEAVVTRCLNKEPDERYQNARELEAALRACADHQPDLRTSSGIEAKADVRKVAGDS